MLLEEAQKDGKSTTYTLGNSYISLYNESVGADYYTITDEQDSVRLVVDEDGNPVARYDYDAFECAIDDDDSAWHTNGSMNSINSRLRYNSQIYDENTEDYYLRFRYYRPQIGRFLQEDIIYEDGLNLYAYCGSNPVVYCDPSGLSSWDDFRKAHKGEYTWNEMIEAYNNSDLKNKDKKIVDPKTGRTYKYSDSSKRPSYGKKQVENLWNKYMVKNPNSKHYGQVWDKKNKTWLSWDKTKKRQGQWDMGHIDGQLYRLNWEKYINNGFSDDFDENEKKFLEWYRNNEHYRPEECHGNRSDNQKSKNLCKSKG